MNKKLHEGYLAYWREYRKKNREKLRNYQREYQRQLRAKKKLLTR